MLVLSVWEGDQCEQQEFSADRLREKVSVAECHFQDTSKVLTAFKYFFKHKPGNCLEKI